METDTNALLLNKKHLRDWSFRQSVVDAFEEWDGTLKDFSASRGVSPAAVIKWRKRAAQDTSLLVDQRVHNKGTVTLSPRAAAWCFAYWCDRPKANLRVIHREVSKMAGEVGIPEFSYKQVRRLFANTPGDMRRVIADGQRVAFETACLVSRRKHGRVANRLWELDVTELEVWALNTATGRLFRPWMTSVIDVGHRIIMAAVIHHKEPSTADALAVLEEAMLPKKSVDYPFYGQPKAIRCDNASIYQSAEWLAALMRLGITPDPIPDRCPSANGIIERSFLTFKSGLFCRLAGYTDQYRGLAIAQKRGAIPAPLLPGIVRKFIVGEYHLRKHDALKTTPWESWHEHLDVAEGLIINPDEIREALKLRRTRTVQRDGIEYNGRLFTGECLHGLVNEDVTILVSPSGKDDALTVYLAKNLIGKVTCQDDDPAAVEAINKTRLDRTIEIQRFAKSMRGTVPTDPDATPVVPTVPKGAGEPTPVPQTQEDESELPLGRIPEFSPEE